MKKALNEHLIDSPLTGFISCKRHEERKSSPETGTFEDFSIPVLSLISRRRDCIGPEVMIQNI